jgi:hypothetical protein
MTQPNAFTPYSTLKPWNTTPPSWVPAEDQARINAYAFYEELYWNHINDAYKIMTRDVNEELPIYVPTSRIIVDTVNRYTGKDMKVTTLAESGSPASRATAELALAELFARERFESRYDGNKRYGVMRGDWCWHLMADPTKAPGTKLRLLPVDPASYFPVWDPNDPDRIIRVHLAERLLQGDTFVVKRQTYHKDENSRIWTETAIFEEDAWFAGDGKAMTVLQPLTLLDPRITSIPVYHVPNKYTPGEHWGSSEIRGLEVVAAAMNQGVTDSDLALALIGLGVYATDQPGSPVDPVSGQLREWFIYPGAVVENSKGLRRVEGITSLAPYDSHLDRVWAFMQQAAGANPAAMGKIDVATAESGVALFMEMAPILSSAEEKDRLIKDTHQQLLHDLKSWFLVYESVNFMDVVLVPTFGDKLPTNRKAEVDLVVSMMSTVPPVLSAQSARNYLKTKGFPDLFADDEEERVQAEMADVAAAAQGSDPLALRAAGEAGLGTTPEPAVAEPGGSTGATGGAE